MSVFTERVRLQACKVVLNALAGRGLEPVARLPSQWVSGRGLFLRRQIIVHGLTVPIPGHGSLKYNLKLADPKASLTFT